MILRINKQKLESLTYCLILAQVFIFRYFNVHEEMNKVIVILIFLCCGMNWIVQNRNTLPLRVNRWHILLALLFTLALFNGLIYGFRGYYKSNILMLLYVLLQTQFLAWYQERYPERVLHRLYCLRFVINIYYIINILVMFVQLNDQTFLVGYSDFEAGASYDLINGLFGYQMMPAMSLFSVFVVIYNLALLKSIRNVSKKMLLAAYCAITTLLHSVISIQNDNVGYFLLLVITVTIVFMGRYPLNTVKMLKRCFGVILLLLGIVCFVIIIKPDILTSIYDKLLYKVIGLFKYAKAGSSIRHGSMERLSLVVYGLSNAGGWLLGDGLSTSGWYTPGTYGFVHFGNGNIGAVICLAGIWFYLILTGVSCYKNIRSIIVASKGIKTGYYFCAVFCYYALVSLYTLPYTDISIGICLQIVMMGIWLNEKSNSGRRENGTQSIGRNCYF